MTPYRLSPTQLAAQWCGGDWPFGVIDLADRAWDAAPIVLPPFPLLGLGPADHPLATRIDCLLEPPATLTGLAASISAHPHAARVLTGLLREIEDLPIAAALEAESLAYGLLQGSADHDLWLAQRVPQQSAPPGRLDMHRADDILRLTLDRPKALNAIDRALRDALREAFELAALDPEIARVELRGSGKAFSIGADLAEFGTTRDPATAHAIRMQTLPAHAIALVAHKLAVHIDGACIGAGLEMAAFAHRITASRSAWFQLPELAMGLIPGAGGCVSLARRIGRQRTALMVLSGKRVSAGQALEWGLVDELTG